MLSKNKAYRSFEIICLVVVLLMSPFIISETSPLYQNPNADNAIFLSVSKGITEGKLPYVDLIENKGPLFFLMQAFFLLLAPGANGIFILEAIVLLAYSLLILFLVRRLTGVCQPLFAVLALICGLWKYSGNNFCEEYDLLFTLAGIAVMLCRYTDTDRTKKWYAYALGVCTACVCFIKMSDILVLGVTILFYIYDVIRSKRSFWAEALRFLAGFALITVPVCLYLLFTGTFLPMIQEYILNNLVHIRVGKNTGFWASRKYIITHGYGLASIRPVINMAVGLILMLMIQPADERRQPFERKLRFYAVACTFAALLVGYVAGSGFFQHLVLEKNTNVLALLLVFRALAQRFSASAVPKFRRLSWVLSGIVLAAAIVFFVSALDPDQFIWSEKRQQELAELMEFNEEYQEYSDSVYALRITPRCFWINDIYPAYPYYNLSGFINECWCWTSRKI